MSINLLNQYITGNDTTKDAIKEKLKTELFKLKRRQIEDRIRKSPVDFLRVMAALDVDKSLK